MNNRIGLSRTGALMLSLSSGTQKCAKGMLLAGFAVTPFIQATAQKQPNVILIITDDQGYGDLGIHGNPHVKTPNIDRFAKESARFTNFYVSPVSAPTRSSLMTGRYSMRTGVRDTYNGGAIMASSEVTIAEILKEKGYSTGVFGKWHLGDNYPSRPGDQGFDKSVIHLTGGMAQPGDITTYLRGDSAYYDPVLWHNGKQQKYNGYCSDVFTGQALDFIKQNRSKPFFCYLAFNAPHTPLQLPDIYNNKYYNIYNDINPSSGFPDKLAGSMTDKDREDARKVYAMVSNIDDNVGKVLRLLDETGLKENTVVIFMTDNGPQQRRYNGGMNGLKGSVYRGGVRVPFFISYPAMKIANRDVDVTSAHIDVLPTLAEICRAELPPGRKIDGRSMVPFILKNEKISDSRPLFFYWTRKNPEKYNNIALMKGNYRLIGQADYNSEDEGLMLFDTETDPGETRNIFREKAVIAGQMKKSLDSMLLELSGSENMQGPLHISVGTPYENPVILNRNDAWGERGVWEQEEVYGVWNLEVSEGMFDIRFRFKNPVPGGGRMMIDLNALSLQKRTSGENQLWIEMKDVRLPGGKYTFYPFYETGNRRILPLWVEIERK